MDIYDIKSINGIDISKYLNNDTPSPTPEPETDDRIEKMIRRNETYYNKYLYNIKIIYWAEYDPSVGGTFVKINLTISNSSSTSTQTIFEHELMDKLSSIKCVNELIIEDEIDGKDIYLNYVKHFDVIKYLNISKGRRFKFSRPSFKNVELLVMNKPSSYMEIFNMKNLKIASIVDSISSMEHSFDNFAFSNENIIKYYGISNADSQQLVLYNLNYENMYIDVPNFTFYNNNMETEEDIPKIKNIVIGNNNITSIPELAFMYCTNLSTIKLSNSILNISQYAFCATFSLKQIHIPDSVTKIEDYAFVECMNLEEINFNDTSNLKYVGDSAFNNSYNLTKINIPNSITYLGSYAFNNCQLLCDINIPTGITKINNSTFSGCCSLSSVYIPSNIIEIGDEAFDNIEMTTITCHTNIQTISHDAFNGDDITSVRIISPTLTQDVRNVKQILYEGINNPLFYYGTDGNWTFFT